MTAPALFFSRRDHRGSPEHGCECQLCSPTPRGLLDYALPNCNGTRAASFVIRNRGTGLVLFETYNAALVVALDHSRYEAVPILDYLYEYNRIIRNGQCEHIECDTTVVKP
jgi:hypothetical protein